MAPEKLVGLLRRASDVSLESFRDSWMRDKRLSDYVARCERNLKSLALDSAYRDRSPFCDGLQEWWFADVGSRDDFVRGVVKEPPPWLSSDTLFLSVDSIIVVAGEPGNAAVKSVILNYRKLGMDRSQFLDYWRNEHPKVAAILPGLLKYEQNPTHQIVRLDGQRGPQCDGISLAWFPSTKSLKDLAGSKAYAAALADEKNFLHDGGNLPIVLMREQTSEPQM